jgi:protein-S-isoprenylcysteine O-methyltransferase Ste14
VNFEQVFRWLFVGIFVAVFAISAAFRRRARQSGEVIPRAREGAGRLLLRFVFAAPLYLGILAYMLNPAWMAWSSLPVPAWVRWLGAALGLAMVPMVYWVMRSLGTNVSETVLTKAHHRLVSHGPYRWVRHPLYAVATTAFLSLGVLAANAFLLAVAVLALAAIALLVIPAEEKELLHKFGDDYRRYMARTGRLWPRIGPIG